MPRSHKYDAFSSSFRSEVMGITQRELSLVGLSVQCGVSVSLAAFMAVWVPPERKYLALSGEAGSSVAVL